MATETLQTSQPSIHNYVLGFLAVGLAWGFTTPFMRKAAMTSKPVSRPQLDDPKTSFLVRKAMSIWYAVYDLVTWPAYSIPLLLNLSGSVWFFLLVGQAGMSMLSFEDDIWQSPDQAYRIESYCSYYKLTCVLVHGAGRVVRGWESNIKRFDTPECDWQSCM